MRADQYARMKDLFHRVVEIAPGKRDRFLDEACADDPELRDEIDSLLRHDDSRTIIRSADATVANFWPTNLTVARRSPFAGVFARWDQITQGLGQRGLLALGGLISCIVLALIGYVGQRYISQFQREVRREALNDIVDGKVLGLRMWLENETEKAESWARSERLRESIGQLVTLANENDELPEKFNDLPLIDQIQSEITAMAGRKERFTIWDRRYRLIADSISDGDRIGQYATPFGSSVLASVFRGHSELISFDRNHSITKLDDSMMVTPHLAIVTPIRNASGRIIAAFQVHDTDSTQKSTRIMRAFQIRESGETYVFNKNGLMLTRGRFNEQLEQAGLIQKATNTGVRHVYLRDPGGDITKGYQIDGPTAALPLTEMARRCIASNDGDDLDGYRDYRGVTVVGAWRWLDDIKVGVATELDANEAYPSSQITRTLSWVIVTQMAICMCVVIGSFYSVSRLRKNFGEDQKLGQYRLEKQIGEGGMGKVFKAQHVMLKKPTAVKLLKPEFSDPDSIARFQREARLVSQLEHFNTIRVFDYGVSKEQIFYLAMEYIDGVTLSELVELETTISPSRTVFLLRQILCSLREAHETGLVHRDLKPSNVMVCTRGGVADVAKVLDFGLVKLIHSTESQLITVTSLVAGTPQYLAPERLSNPGTNDPRSDLFSFGALAFFLLTGRNAVDGQSLAEILHRLANVPPSRPSKHTNQLIAARLDDLVFRCLSKDPNDRPDSAQQIIDELDSITEIPAWSESEADQWWASFQRLRR